MTTKYRNGRTLYHPNTDGSYQAETFPSINRAKAESRRLSRVMGRTVVKRGKPSTKAAQPAG